jgi:hypothetical protein
MSRYRSQIREVINRNALVTVALAQGYNAFLPVYDNGVDFILYREEDGDVRKVQLKGRWYIDRKYSGRDIWIAFHEQGRWYLAPHDKLVRMGEEAGFTATKSWIEGGAYSCRSLSRDLRAKLEPYAFQPLEAVAQAAATGRLAP